jgi:hypothetical protein
MADKNFIVKNGLEVGGQEVVSSSGVVTSAALGGQTLASTDSPTFNNLTLTNDIAVGGDLNLTGDLNITGDVNSLSVTDLDVTDQTITLGAGQVESASGGSGIIVDGSNASILWDETNDEWDFNKVLKLTTPSATTASITAEETSGATIRMGAGGSSGFIGTMSNHYLRFLVNSQEKASLTADGSFTVTNDVKLTGTNPRIDFDGNGSGALRFYSISAAQERMRITSGGNVGIGTDNPQDRLHVTLDSATTNAEVEVMRVEATSSGTPVDGFGPFIDFRGDRQAGNPDSYGRIGFESDGMTPTTVDGAFIIQPAEDGVYTERMRVSSGGNVGIGTSNPQMGLHVGSGSQSIAALPGIGIANGSSAYSFFQASDGTKQYIAGVDHNITYTKSGTLSNHDHAIVTNNTNRIYIENTGNVGIGTDSPDYALDVYDVGEAWIRADSSHTTESTANSGLRFAHGGVNHGVLYHRGSDDALLYFDNVAASTRFLLDSSGKFGIGTDDPIRRLHINSSTDNMVARFQSTDSTGGIELMDNAGSVELEAVGEVFNVHPGGLGTRTFTSSVDNHLFTTTYVHGDTSTHFDAQFLNTGTANRGPRVRIRGGGQSSGVSSAVPWDSQQGYDIGSLWFDSSEGPSIFGAGIAATAESDWNTNDTPSALAFYTTPDQTGAQTNTAKERLRIRADGTAHLSPTESNTHLYLGSAGGLTGGNNSINVRAAGNNMMLNSVGQLIVERTGTQKFLVDETYSKVTTNGVDAYNLRVESTSSGDSGLSMWRAGQAGFGINVRTSTTNYADLMVSTGGEPAYNPAGTTNAPIRIYQNNNVSMPHSAAWSTGIGNTFGATGSHYMVRSANSTGNETIIINNQTVGSLGILQYRINAGVQGQYLIGTSGSGITFTGSSDYRLKENVSTITESSLDKINQLRLVSYNWNEHSDMPTDELQIGVIAHEIEEVFPEFVDGEKDAVYTQEEIDARGDPETTNEEVGDIKAQTVSLVNKDMIIHILKAMQELKAENDALRARIETLEG